MGFFLVDCFYNSQIPIPLQVSTDTPSLRKPDLKGRSALLADIQQGTRLRKVTQINDRSAPQIEGE
jgi:hypothetical protein